VRVVHSAQVASRQPLAGCAASAWCHAVTSTQHLKIGTAHFRQYRGSRLTCPAQPNLRTRGFSRRGSRYMFSSTHPFSRRLKTLNLHVLNELRIHSILAELLLLQHLQRAECWTRIASHCQYISQETWPQHGRTASASGTPAAENIANNAGTQRRPGRRSTLA
jgi:hypothetical protein